MATERIEKTDESFGLKFLSVFFTLYAKVKGNYTQADTEKYIVDIVKNLLTGKDLSEATQQILNQPSDINDLCKLLREFKSQLSPSLDGTKKLYERLLIALKNDSSLEDLKKEVEEKKKHEKTMLQYVLPPLDAFSVPAFNSSASNENTQNIPKTIVDKKQAFLDAISGISLPAINNIRVLVKATKDKDEEQFGFVMRLLITYVRSCIKDPETLEFIALKNGICAASKSESFNEGKDLSKIVEQYCNYFEAIFVEQGQNKLVETINESWRELNGNKNSNEIAVNILNAFDAVRKNNRLRKENNQYQANPISPQISYPVSSAPPNTVMYPTPRPQASSPANNNSNSPSDYSSHSPRPGGSKIKKKLV